MLIETLALQGFTEDGGGEFGDEAQHAPCHPERSGCFAKRSSRVVEGPITLSLTVQSTGILTVQRKPPLRSSATELRGILRLGPRTRKVRPQAPLKMTVLGWEEKKALRRGRAFLVTDCG